MVGRREPVQHMHVGVKSDKALAELRRAVPTAVSSDEVDVALVIDRRRLTRLPNACFLPSGRSVKDANLLQRGSVVSQQKSVIRILIAVRCIAYKNIASGKDKRRTLVLHQRVEAWSHNGSRAVWEIGSGGKVQGVEALGEPASGFAQGHHIERGLFLIHHRRADNAHAAVDIGAAEVRIAEAGGSPEVDMPERGGRTRVVGIERIHAIVDCGHIHDIMPAARYLYVGHEQRLAIDLVVNHPLEDHAELPGVDISGG